MIADLAKSSDAPGEQVVAVLEELPAGNRPSVTQSESLTSTSLKMLGSSRRPVRARQRVAMADCEAHALAISSDTSRQARPEDKSLLTNFLKSPYFLLDGERKSTHEALVTASHEGLALHTELYMPSETYQALVNELACALSPWHTIPADRLAAVTAVLVDHDLNRPELAVVIAQTERWPVTADFDADQVRYLLGEEGGVWPDTIREEAEQDDRPIVLPAGTLRLCERAMAENQAGRDLLRPA